MKKCSKCGELKPLTDFYKDQRIPVGLYSACKKCHNKDALKYHRSSNSWKEYLKQWMRKRKKNDPKFRLDSIMATAIYTAFQGDKGGSKWQELVGYTIKDLIKHLEKQFDKKMSWDNYGSYWAVDHIKPRSLFDYKNPEDQEFKECWALDNLQPMERIANIKKSNSYFINL